MKVLAGGAIGAATMYFFDPQMGRSRRAKLAQRFGAMNREMARDAARKAEYARGQAEGLRHAATSDSPPEDDQTLKHKVESEVLARQKFPKGSIAVNAVGGVVEVRGELESPEQITDLEQQVRKVTGVVDVHNLLHLPGTPPPNKADALKTS